MRILVCGAQGFIGRHIASALELAGHRVVQGISGKRAAPRHDHVVVDYSRDIDPDVWRPRLANIDVVVNAVGVLRDSGRRPMDLVHVRSPASLFEACAQVGVRHVVQISALGIEQGTTPYAVTKRAIDERVLELATGGRIRALVLRPSVVYGRGGESAKMFDTLARCPLLPLPAEVARCRVQPMHVDDLAAGVCAAVDASVSSEEIVACVGPRSMSLAGFIATLRQRLGRRPAITLTLPSFITRWSAAIGDAIPVTPWGSQALALLATDNTADPTPFRDLLGRSARDPATFAC